MVKTTDLFKVNGKPMFPPDAGIEIKYNDIDAPDSGRDESAVMHRIVVLYNVFTGNFEFSSITEEEKQYIDSLFPNKPDFLFTHPSRKNSAVPVTERCYRSNYGITWQNSKTGMWKNYKFSIVACGGEQEDV